MKKASTVVRDGHAVVIGGSMAGLLAARVLADRFARVTIVERDRFPLAPGARKGVPQARHAHVLLVRGGHVLEDLLPGLAAELADAGAPEVDWTADTYWRNFAGLRPRFRSHLTARVSSRDLLEWTVRRRLAALLNVTFLQDVEAAGLVPDAAGASVRAVTIRPRTDALSEHDLVADLVVDASGRSSRAPQWLEALGYTPPRETTINAFLGYASRCYRRPATASSDWKVVNLQAAPPATSRGGVILPLEGDRWMVTLAGVGRDYPPTDEDGFLAFARSLPDPILYEAIRAAEPISPVYGYRRTENRLRHFEEMRRRPERFVVLGDAACAFNPVYGQGMTVAALGALALGQALDAQRGGDLAGLAGRFQRRLAKAVATPWLLATGEDYRVPATEGGRRTLATRLMHLYMDGVLSLGAESIEANLAVAEVLHLLTPPAALFRPSIAMRVLAKEARGLVARAPSALDFVRVRTAPVEEH